MTVDFFGIPFLFYFLPLYLGIYYITSDKNKPLTILLGSILFYLLQRDVAIWQVGVALALTVITFVAGKGVRTEKHSFLLPFCLTLLGAVLVFFKLYQRGRYLPAGMSFYIFQMAAYLIEVQRGNVQPECSLISYGAQMLMFPRLLAGPLVEPAQLQSQMAHPRPNQVRFHSGLQELVFGLVLKVMLADRLAGAWNHANVIGLDKLGVAQAWVALVSFAVRLYLDFHGYSMIAVGLGKMMGFEFPRNFDSPYAAKSVSEFYRRWHMTLTRWFRQYVYIPLGGNRNGKLRMALNVLIVWSLTGLWHGVGGSFLLWGVFLGMIMVAEKLWWGKKLQQIGVGANIYTVVVILLSWIPFAIGDAGKMIGFVFRLVGNGGVKLGDFINYLPILIVGVIFISPIPERFFDRYRKQLWFDGMLFVLFWVCIYFVSTTAQDPFLYFHF